MLTENGSSTQLGDISSDSEGVDGEVTFQLYVAACSMAEDTRAMLRAVDERVIREDGEIMTCESALAGRSYLTKCKS